MKKKITFIAIIFSAIFSGCVKQKDCEGGISGTFRYLEEPMYVKPNCDMKEKKAVAIFHNNMYITGHVPKKYQSLEPINVTIIFKTDYMHTDIACPEVYKLICIEKED